MTGLATHNVGAVPLDQFVDYVLPSVHNAPEEIVMHYIRTAAIEFTRHTCVLKDLVSIDVQANVGDYTIPCLNDQVNVFMVKSVSYLRRPLKRLAHNPVQDRWQNGYGRYQEGYWFEAPTELHVRPLHTYDVPNGVTVEVVLQPSQDATSLAMRLYDDYAEVLADGALMRLLAMKTADWFDPQAAGIHFKRFKNGKNLAKNLILRGDSTEPVMARGPRWA